MKRWTKFAIFLALIVLAFWGCDKLFEQSMSVKRNVNHYANYLAEMPPHLVGHFPKQLRGNSDARVAFSTGPLQANMFLQIRMKLDVDSIADIQNQAKSKAIAEYQGGGMFDHYNDDQENNFPTTAFHTDDSKQENFGEFPNHYTLYVLSAKQPLMDWETTGIAISTETNPVIYWAEDD